jgi:cell division protease FtsH
VARTQNVSEETAGKIDAEVRRFVDECYTRAEKILTDGIDDLHALAKALLEYETLTGDDIDAILKGETLHRAHPADDDPSGDAPAQSSVPNSGAKESPGGMEPEPQPGS